MKKHSFTLLATLIWSALYGQKALANLSHQCLLGTPTYTKPLLSDDSSLPMHIQANKVSANYPKHALFSGNVDIKQGDNRLTADEVQLMQYQDQHNMPLRTVIARGDVNYSNNDIKLQGMKAWSNLNTKDTNIYQGSYQMIGRQGRGNATIMKQRGNNRYIILENGSFTSCLPGDDSWSIVGSQVVHDRKEQIAKIWNARFKIGKVPVFYSPYLQVPVGEKRRSGFLISNAKYSNNNGFELSTPYYINLGNNYDATITPKYMSRGGAQLQTEFRYLTTLGEGLVQFDWLPKDLVYNDKYVRDSDNDRWLLYWRHNGIVEQVWRFNIDYARVSNSDYFNYLDTKYGSSAEGYAVQKFNFGYADTNWNIALSHKQFQILDTNNNTAYRAAPQLDVTYHQNEADSFNFSIFSQAVKFTNLNSTYPEATRLHIEPRFSLYLFNYWSSLNTETKLMVTHYQQENIDDYNENINTIRHLKSSVSRVLPQFKTDGKIMLERYLDYAPDYIQTLEPRIQYLYVPYCNQNDIGFYDSTILQTDYSGIFRDRSYSGLDRILPANQLACGITTRIYKAQHIERLIASLGQIYYFSQPHTTNDIMGTLDNYDTTGNMVWAGESCWHISNQWRVRGSLQYSSQLKNVAFGDGVLEYHHNKNRILQLHYRYVNPQYIKQMLSDITRPDYQQGISQMGITGIFSMVKPWSFFGSYYYDTKVNQSVDQLVGLQYNACCWAINVGYERKVSGWKNIDNSSQYDNKVSFNIELRGLSSNHDLESAEKMLSSSILPYRRIF